MDKLKKLVQKHISELDVDEPKLSAWDAIKKGLSTTESDLLKSHISENRNTLDLESPDVKTWTKISQAISTEKTFPAWSIKRGLVYLSAACIVVIISIGVFRYMNIDKSNPGKEVVKTSFKKVEPTDNTINADSIKTQLIVAQPAPEVLPKQEIKSRHVAVAASEPVVKTKKESLPPVVMQIEKDYDQLIAGQIAYTKTLAVYGENPAYFQEFMDDFKTLEQQEKELRKSILENGLQENNINDLAMIYQQKLTVLKKLQNEINKTSNRNKNLTDTIPTYINL